MPATEKSACRKRKANSAVPCSIPMPIAMQEALMRRAMQEDRSFSATIRQAVAAYLARP
jgi:hypothetical protein